MIFLYCFYEKRKEHRRDACATIKGMNIKKSPKRDAPGFFYFE